MEGTNAKWCHAKSAAYVRDAKPEGDVHSNLPKQRSPLENNGFLSIKLSLSGGSKYKVLETRLRWRGRMRLEPCQIGSIRPRRQALGRRTLHLPRPWSHLEIQWFHSLSSCQIGWIWGYACDGGDVCDWSLAKSAAHVHDAKPEGDVHSILSNPYDLTCFIPSQTSKAFGPVCFVLPCLWYFSALQ